MSNLFCGQVVLFDSDMSEVPHPLCSVKIEGVYRVYLYLFIVFPLIICLVLCAVMCEVQYYTRTQWKDNRKSEGREMGNDM